MNNWNKEHQLFLERISSLTGMSDDFEVQKNKFALLSELLLKLCTSRNMKSNFKNLTSLLLLFLNMYRKNYPLDVYTADSIQKLAKKQEDLNIKRILRQELL